MKAAIYTRISRDRAGAGLGVERQEQECRDLAERRNLDVIEVYSDNDISAFAGKHRPGYEAMLDGIRAGRFDVLVCWHTDRLTRSVRELEDLIDVLGPRDIPVLAVRSGDDDLTTANGRAMARQRGVWSRLESEQKAERIRSAKRQAAAKGAYRGGQRPFGYEKDGVTVRDSEADAIRQAARDLLDGRSLGALAREWNAAGLTTARGRPWDKVKMRELLLRARLAGLIESKGEIVGPAQWEPLIPEETWRAVVALLRDPSRLTHGGGRPEAKWLLSGIAKCGFPVGDGICGARCIAAVGRQEARWYKCSKSVAHVGRNLVPTDDLVLRTIAERLSRPDAADMLARHEDMSHVDAARERAQVLRARQDDLAVAFAEGTMTARQVGVATAKLKADLAAAEAILTAAADRSALGWLAAAEDPAEAFLNATLDRQRAIIDALVRITILPAPKGRPKGWTRARPIVDPKYVDIQFK